MLKGAVYIFFALKWIRDFCTFVSHRDVFKPLRCSYVFSANKASRKHMKNAFLFSMWASNLVSTTLLVTGARGPHVVPYMAIGTWGIRVCQASLFTGRRNTIQFCFALIAIIYFFFITEAIGQKNAFGDNHSYTTRWGMCATWTTGGGNFQLLLPSSGRSKNVRKIALFLHSQKLSRFFLHQWRQHWKF